MYLLTHPEAQAKMQMELDQIIGNERRVTLADRSDLPYTNAVINVGMHDHVRPTFEIYIN